MSARAAATYWANWGQFEARGRASPWDGNYRSLDKVRVYKDPVTGEPRTMRDVYAYQAPRVRGKSYRAAEAAKIAAILRPAKPKRVRKPAADVGVPKVRKPRVKKEKADVG